MPTVLCFARWAAPALLAALGLSGPRYACPRISTRAWPRAPPFACCAFCRLLVLPTTTSHGA
eukprot:5669901-Lingulodinium_polyedra.AAC.1